MKKPVLLVVLFSVIGTVNAQNILDSIQDMADHWRRYGTVSIEAGYMLSVRSKSDIENYFHQKGTLLLDLEYKKSKVKIGVGIEKLHFRNTELYVYPYSYDVRYLTLPISYQYRLFDLQWFRMYLGAGFEWDWIVDYDFTNEGNTVDHPSARNPEIGKRTGMRGQIPLTCYFHISQQCCCYVNMIVQFQICEDHDEPEETNKWGVITPERDLNVGLPLWIGLGLQYSIR